jgi:prevent-host-death family protein
MRVLAMRDAKTGLSATLDEAQHDRVLITRNGKPSAIVIGVEGREFEDVLLMSNPKFWEMIEARQSLENDEVQQHESCAPRVRAGQPVRVRDGAASRPRTVSRR